MSERSGWRVRVEWKIQDAWIGVFWKSVGGCVDLWICLLPCIPIHIFWSSTDDRSR